MLPVDAGSPRTLPACLPACLPTEDSAKATSKPPLTPKTYPLPEPDPPTHTHAEDNENLSELARRLVRQEGLPKFEPVELRLGSLLEEGERLVMEQDLVSSSRLSHEYLKRGKKAGRGLIGLSG